MRAAPDVAIESSDMTPMIDVVFQLLIFFMLTMQFKEVEGKLLSQLPKTAGLPDRTSTPREEVRIAVRGEGDVRRVSVEKHEIGEVALTEKRPERGTSNQAVYRAAAARARGLVDALGAERCAVVLDADGETAYEHVIGLLDACKALRIDTLEFVGNPRFERYYR